MLICLSFSENYAQNNAVKDDEFSNMVNGYLAYTVPVISVRDLRATKEKILLLDTREQAEYDVSHLPNAIYVGYDSFKPSAMKGIDKNAKIVVYCTIGYRSEKIGERLLKMGYKKVYNLYGSIFEWINSGYEVVDKSGKPTFNIHTYDKSWSKWVKNGRYKKVY